MCGFARRWIMLKQRTSPLTGHEVAFDPAAEGSFGPLDDFANSGNHRDSVAMFGDVFELLTRIYPGKAWV